MYHPIVNPAIFNAADNVRQPPSTVPDQVISARQQALLNKMATQPDNESFATWKANNKPRYLTTTIQKLDSYLSELSLIEPEAYQRFSARLQQVELNAIYY